MSVDLLPLIMPGSSRARIRCRPIDLTEITVEEIADDYANKRVDTFLERDKTFTTAGWHSIFGAADRRLADSDQSGGRLVVYMGRTGPETNMYMAAPGVAVPDAKSAPIFSPRQSSWGYRLGGALILQQRTSAASTLRPRIVWSHDVDGTSPVGAGPFLEEPKGSSVSVSVVELYQAPENEFCLQCFLGSAAITASRNLINDRDNFEFSIGYNF